MMKCKPNIYAQRDPLPCLTLYSDSIHIQTKHNIRMFLCRDLETQQNILGEYGKVPIGIYRVSTYRVIRLGLTNVNVGSQPVKIREEK